MKFNKYTYAHTNPYVTHSSLHRASVGAKLLYEGARRVWKVSGALNNGGREVAVNPGRKVNVVPEYARVRVVADRGGWVPQEAILARRRRVSAQSTLLLAAGST